MCMGSFKDAAQDKEGKTGQSTDSCTNREPAFGNKFSNKQFAGSTSINENYGDTVPSRPQQYEVLNEFHEGDFGTVVVHSEVGKNADTIGTPDSSTKELVPILGGIRSSFSHDSRDRTPSLWSENETGTIIRKQSDTEQGPETLAVHGLSSPSVRLPKAEASSDTGEVGGRTIRRGTFKCATLNRKAFSVQDKLWSIYAAGNTVPIPFLKAIDISPLALVSENIVGDKMSAAGGDASLEAVKELFSGDGQSKKARKGQNEVPLPPGVHQRLTSSPTLMNLAQALAYHKMCYEDMPLQELQATQEQQTIQNLCDTLRTILRL